MRKKSMALVTAENSLRLAEARSASGDDPKTWAQEFIRSHMGEEHVADLDWENSEVIDD